MLVAQQGRETSPTLRLTLPNCPWQLPGRPHPLVTLYDEKVLELSINLHTLSAVNSYADVGNPKD
jgi:hypothetical protein